MLVYECGGTVENEKHETAEYATVEMLLDSMNTRMEGKKKRGFASMDAEKQRAIASMGGKASHEKGTAHEFTSEEARAAGKKGGEARKKKV